VEVDAAPGVAVRSLTLTVKLPDGAEASGLLNGTPPALPGRAVVKLADVAQDIDLTLDGFDQGGGEISAGTTVRSVPHEQVWVMLTVGEQSGGDGFQLPDLSTPDGGGDGGPAIHYERQLTITNGASAALPTGYTVRVPLDPANFPDARLRTDFADVRLFGPSGELPRVVDPAPPGQTRALWFALAQPIAAGASDTSYSVHYGDPNATASSSDATKVFALYDGFDSGVLGTFWQVSGSPTLGGGNLTLHGNGVDGVTTTAASDQVPTLSALELRARVPNPASGGQTVSTNTFWYWFGYQREGDFNPIDPWAIFIARAANQIQAERKVAGSANCANTCTGAAATQDSSFHWYRIERTPSTTLFYIDGVSSYTATDPNDTDWSLMLRNYAVATSVQVDWVRARALATPEPTVSVGPETVH
jgi:hypothetical protein